MAGGLRRAQRFLGELMLYSVSWIILTIRARAAAVPSVVARWILKHHQDEAGAEGQCVEGGVAGSRSLGRGIRSAPRRPRSFVLRVIQLLEDRAKGSLRRRMPEFGWQARPLGQQRVQRPASSSVRSIFIPGT